MKKEACGCKRGRPRVGERRIVTFRADADVSSGLDAIREAGGEMGAFINIAIRKALEKKGI